MFWILLLEKSRAQIKATALLTNFTVAHGDDTMLEWRNMIPKIWTTYRDGYVVSGLDQPTASIKRMSYPLWWLQQVGFFNPMNLNHDKDAILFATDPSAALNSAAAADAVAAAEHSKQYVAAVDQTNETRSVFSSSLLTLVGGLVMGLVIGQYVGEKQGRRSGYAEVPSIA